MAVLKEARNVKYGQFVAPGDALKVEVIFNKETESGASFKASGTVRDETALSARLELAYFNLTDQQPALSVVDEKLREHNRQRWEMMTQGRLTI
jgi:3-hydroxyacyl-[acyl-carrier-protein] dehydratase